MEELVTYLRLAPEFGGTRFGPFETIEVRLGSDPENCHIVLQADLGVHPDHVKLLRQGPKNLILAPASRTATVYLWKKGATKASQLSTPTAVSPGDAFSLVTAEGPRFIIELDELPEEIKAQREAKGGGPKTGRSRLNKDAFAKEGKRQIFTRLLVLGPAQLVQRAWIYVKSGAIFMPRNMILMGMIASGWVFGGATSCKGKKLQSDLVVTNQRLESCKQTSGFVDNIGPDSDDANIPELVARVMKSPKLGNTLAEDDTLRAEVERRSKILFREVVKSPKKYQWVMKGQVRKAREFGRWRERVMKLEKIDIETRKLIVWLGLDVQGRLAKEFKKTLDSEGEQVCTRGPLQMTYRQALSLGMSVQPDGFIARDPARYRENKQAREERLEATIMAAGGEGLPEDTDFESDVTPVQQGVSACVHIRGEDDRLLIKDLVPMVRRSFGDEAVGVPAGFEANSSVARLAKFFAAELMQVDYRQPEPGIDFSDSQVSTVLDAWDARGQWVMKRTAETIAKAIVMPCIAVLSGDAQAAEATFGNELPQAVPCLVLDWKLRNER
jgi:hypothetical protein